MFEEQKSDLAESVHQYSFSESSLPSESDKYDAEPLGWDFMDKVREEEG